MHTYARIERERRFLLGGVPAGEVVRTAHIVDRYLDGTTLRLRAMTIGGETTYKLTQKTHGTITTIYLRADEHALLSSLPALVLEKTRLSIPPFGIDVFAPPRDGLVLAEVEFETDEAMRAFVLPEWAIAEVTDDPRFTGGAIARAMPPARR